MPTVWDASLRFISMSAEFGSCHHGPSPKKTSTQLCMPEDNRQDAGEIEVLTALQAVRRRPAMYVGDMEDHSLPTRLLMQALCHAADCAMDDNCSRVEIRIDGLDAEVEYDAGMPVDPKRGDDDQIPLIFLAVHAGCHNRKRHLEIGDELCEIGLMVLNALSEWMTVTTSFCGWSARYRFIKGVQIERPCMTPTEENDHTSILFRLDQQILRGNTRFDRGLLENLVERFREILTGTTITILPLTQAP